MFTLKVKIGQGFTLEDVINKCNQGSIPTDLIREKDNSRNMVLQIDNKYNQEILNILELLEIEKGFFQCRILLRKEINISKLEKELKIISNTKNKLVFNTDKSINDLLDYINTNVLLEDLESLIDIDYDVNIFLKKDKLL